MIYSGASQWHYYLGINPKRFVINEMKSLFARFYERMGSDRCGLVQQSTIAVYVNNMTWSEVAFGAPTSHSKLMEIFLGGGKMVALRIGLKKSISFGTVLKSQWRSDERPTNFSIDFSYSMLCFALAHYVRFLDSPHFYCVLRERICRKLNNVTNDTVDWKPCDHTRELIQTNKRTNKRNWRQNVEMNNTKCIGAGCCLPSLAALSLLLLNRFLAMVPCESDPWVLSAAKTHSTILHFPNDSMELYGSAIKKILQSASMWAK